jgi:hypothetical protein
MKKKIARVARVYSSVNQVISCVANVMISDSIRKKGHLLRKDIMIASAGTAWKN